MDEPLRFDCSDKRSLMAFQHLVRMGKKHYADRLRVIVDRRKGKREWQSHDSDGNCGVQGVGVDVTPESGGSSAITTTNAGA